MASTIKLKNSTTAGNSPSSLETGEVAINVADGNLFYGSASAVLQNFVVDELQVKGNLTAQQYIVSSSVTYTTQSFSSGSTIFGDTQDDTHLFTGSISVTGSVTATSFVGDGSGLTGIDSVPAGTISSSAQFTSTDDVEFRNVTASGDISASGDLIIGGGLEFGGDSSINTINAGDDLSINPERNLLLGTQATDVVQIGRQSGTGGAGRTEIYANTSTIAVKFQDSTIEFNHPITASGDISASGDLSIKGIPNVSASIASAGGGGAVATYTNGTDNRIITSTGTDGINGEASLTFNGTNLQVAAQQNFTPSSAIRGIHTKIDTNWESAVLVSSGEYVTVGTAISRTAHNLYVLGSSGWVQADADALSTSTGLLGVAVDGSSGNDFLVKGVFNISGVVYGAPAIGDTVYVHTIPGAYTVQAPSATGDVVRAVGHIVDSFVSGRTTYWKIYFNPSPDFIEN